MRLFHSSSISYTLNLFVFATVHVQIGCAGAVFMTTCVSNSQWYAQRFSIPYVHYKNKGREGTMDTTAKLNKLISSRSMRRFLVKHLKVTPKERERERSYTHACQLILMYSRGIRYWRLVCDPATS
jgi:hypothetical protein